MHDRFVCVAFALIAATSLLAKAEVTPELRGQGPGHRLMVAAVGWARGGRCGSCLGVHSLASSLPSSWRFRDVLAPREALR